MQGGSIAVSGCISSTHIENKNCIEFRTLIENKQISGNYPIFGHINLLQPPLISRFNDHIISIDPFYYPV